MTINFEYTIDDVKKEFKELLDSTSGFGRSDADFTEEDYNFKIGQLASCAGQLMKADDAVLKEAVAELEKSKDLLENFDPRYESRFNSEKAFEMDRALQNVLKKHEVPDDEMNHFVLLQALKRYNSMQPDAFEVTTFKEDSRAESIYDYLNNDFDYIELILDDPGMVEFAEEKYNDGARNLAVFSRKAFEEYLGSRIVEDVAMTIKKKRIEGSRSTIEQKLLETILEAIPDIRMKHSGALMESLASFSKKLKQVPASSYNIRDMVGYEIFADWMRDYLSGNMGLSGFQRKLKNERITPHFAPFSEDIQNAYKRWLKDNRIADVNGLAWISEIKPDRNTVMDYYKSRFSEAKFKDIKKVMRICGIKPTVLPDKAAQDPELQKSIQETYKYWLGNTSYSSDNLISVKRGIRLSKVKPGNDIMQKFYKEMLKGDRLDNIEEAISFTAIKPDKDAVFNYYSDKFSSANFRGLRRVMRLTGIPFSQIAADEDMQKQIQRTYKEWLDYRNFENLEEGMEISNIKPEKEMVSKFYRGRLDNGRLDDVEEGIEVTHILPDENLMLRYYKTCLDNGSYSNVERAMEFSKVKPDNNTMQDFYKNKLGNNRLEDIEEGIYLSNINPAPELMLKFYIDRLKEDKLDSIEEGGKVSETTLASLAPAHPELAKEMQDAYRRWLGWRNLEPLREGIRVSRVMPQKDVMFGFYKNALDRGNIDSIVEGIEVSQIMPDETLMDPFYKAWLNQGSFTYVERGVSTIKVKPSNSTMLDFCKEKFRSCRLGELKEGIKVTGTNIADFVSDAGLSREIQNTYRKWLKDHWFSDVKSGVELTQVAPEDGIMQEFYKETIGNGRLDDVESAIGATKVTPNANVMSDFFKSCFENDDMSRAACGIKFSGIKPDVKMMPEIYGKWFKEAKFDMIKKGAKVSEIEPDYSSITQYVQEAYGSWLGSGKFNILEDGIKISKINPEKKAVQDAYESLFRKGEFGRIKKGSEITGITPDYSALAGEAQEIYKGWVRKGRFDTVKKGAGIVGIEPDYSQMYNEIQEGYETASDEGGFELIEKSFGITQVAPKDGIIQPLFRKWLSERMFDSVEKVIKSIGAKPSDLTMDRFYREGFAYDRLDDIETGIRITGVKPDYSSMSGEIQYGYKQALWEHRFDYLSRSIGMTGTKPDERMMSGFYQMWLKEGEFKSVESAITATGIQPEYDVMEHEIQEGYERNLSAGNFGAVELGVELTGIKPPKSSIYASRAKDTFLRVLGARSGSAD